MEDILSPKEQKRLTRDGVALVKPHTTMPLSREMRKKYAGHIALASHNPLRAKRKGKELTYYYGPTPNEHLLVIGKQGVPDVMRKMMKLINQEIVRKREAIFSMIADPDTVFVV
jgi:hypothetical protein